MPEPPSWRDLLRAAIRTPEQRQRIASATGVEPITLNRWVKREVIPRWQNLRRLPDALPQHREALIISIEQEFATIVEAESLQGRPLPAIAEHIPSEFYARIMRAKALTPDFLRFSSLSDLIIQQALKQLDPSRQGLEIVLALCLPPPAGHPIRTLQVPIGRGTPPFREQLEPSMYLVGAESLIGAAVSKAYIQVNQRLREPLGLSPGYATLHEQSAAAAPLLLGGRVAGCLCISSVQTENFSPPRQALVEQYADLLAIILHPDDFYETEHVFLGIVPKADEQQAAFADFRQRMSSLLKEAADGSSPLTYKQAERVILHQVEDELLRYPPQQKLQGNQ